MNKLSYLAMNLLFFPSVTDAPDPPKSYFQQKANPSLYLKYSDDIAVVEREIIPSYKGRVKHQGVSWLAQCEQDVSFQPGDRVLVVGRHSITLIVEPLSGDCRLSHQ